MLIKQNRLLALYFQPLVASNYKFNREILSYAHAAVLKSLKLNSHIKDLRVVSKESSKRQERGK